MTPKFQTPKDFGYPIIIEKKGVPLNAFFLCQILYSKTFLHLFINCFVLECCKFVANHQINRNKDFYFLYHFEVCFRIILTKCLIHIINLHHIIITYFPLFITLSFYILLITYKGARESKPCLYVLIILPNDNSYNFLSP